MTHNRPNVDLKYPITYLFVPGNHPERFAKAVEAAPDAIILDLEDAVHPDSKAAARDGIQAWQESTPSTRCDRYIRLNSVGSPLFKQDLAWLIELRHPERCAGIFLPKAENPSETAQAVERLRAWNPKAKIVAIIETATGLQNVEALSAIPGIARLAFGSLDFSLDINCNQFRDAFLLARSRIVVASRTAGLPAPIDAVTPAIEDIAVVGDDARYARALGFTAKLCIHPLQVDAVQAAFLPDQGQLAWAGRVMQAASRGSHAVKVDGEMVDLPLIEQAQRMLAVANVYGR
ncbi:CoA ester lyase [Pseudomonas sp. LFM046]|uniref:HpcH/HpaI aldolase/citrate lyase family protein n=1 Tax=Pseudomonas sp. LFM046 TaxID=1608357 RepID=UPI0005CFE067|nr:CoA ester lyase [Pseudomonas sp. LFM046]